MRKFMIICSLKRSLLFLILTFVGGNAYTQSTHSDTPINIKEFVIDHEVFNKANTTLEINDAMRQEYLRSEKMLKTLLLTIKLKMKYKGLYALIEKEQANWIEYRNKHIEIVFPEVLDGKKTLWGSHRIYHELYNKTEMNWIRAKRLLRWLDEQYEYGTFGLSHYE